MTGRNRPGAQPEYASSGPDPAPWSAATESSRDQRLAEMRRWQDATLRVSVEAVEPSRGSHFSLAACWDGQSSPRTHISTTGGDNRPDSGRLRSTATKPPAVRDREDTAEDSSSSLSSSTSSSDEDIGIDESDRDGEEEEPGVEDPLEAAWEEVYQVLQKKSIDNDDARADIESILRSSSLTNSEKRAVIEAALEKSGKDPVEKQATAESMLRRATRSIWELLDSDDIKQKFIQSRTSLGRCRCPVNKKPLKRISSLVRQSVISPKIENLPEEFEKGGRDGLRPGKNVDTWQKGAIKRQSEAKPKGATSRASQRRSLPVGEDAEDGLPRRETHTPEDARQPYVRERSRLTERPMDTPPVESREIRTNASNVDAEEAHWSTRKSKAQESQVPWKTGLTQRIGSLISKKRNSASPSDSHEDPRPRPPQRSSDRRSSSRRQDPRKGSTEARHGTKSDADESTIHGDGSDDEAVVPGSTTAPGHSQSINTGRNAQSEVPEESVGWRKTRRPTPWASDIEERDSEGDPRRSNSRSSYLEEGDPAEQRRRSNRRREDEEDDEGGRGSGGAALGRRQAGGEGESRRTANIDAEQSSQPQKKTTSNRSGTEQRRAEADCHCVSQAPSVDSRQCACVADVESLSDNLLVPDNKVSSCGDSNGNAQKAASRAGMGDASDSEDCTCSCHGTVNRDPWLKCPSRRDAAKKQTPCDSEVEIQCENLGDEDNAPLKREDTAQKAQQRRKVGAPCVPASCKAALEVWPEPAAATGLGDRPLPRKKKPRKPTAVCTQERRQSVCWWKVLVRWVPFALAILLWLVCVWWLWGVLQPLFVPPHRPKDRFSVCWA